MKTELKILHLEDNLEDAEIILSTIEAEGSFAIDIVRVETREDFTKALESKAFDLILADFKLPSYDGMTALADTRRENPEIPFILVSGTIGEEYAVEALKNGATDYILKDKLVRLVPSVKRALNEVDEISQLKQADADRKKLQEQLNQAQKMEAVGRLAGGVAHDFNNMLGIIIGHAEMALNQVSPGQPFYADLQEILSAAERSSILTRQLLTFARKQIIAPRVLDLNATLDGMLKMLRRLIGENVEFSWLPGSNLGRVKMDPSQIDQILANLCVNANDAIAGVGKITIETKNISLDREYCEHHNGFVPGDYVLLTISDNGCGMDNETMAKIFEPFFTTKGMGKGTGLGLATVYGVIKQNKGFINVYSEPGHGTTFRIYLPRYLSEAEKIPKEDIKAPLLPGDETILLVEDDPAFLKMIMKMLKQRGYNVLAAGSTSEALQLAEDYRGVIHLLLSDVVMPGMNGPTLAKKILSSHTSVKQLFMSGYTDDVIAHHGILNEGVHFIQKPFSAQNLAVKVREVLG